MWIAYVLKVIKDSLRPANYDVYSVEMIYSIDKPKVRRLKSVFWRREMGGWYEHQKEYWVDVTGEYKAGALVDIVSHRPSNVTDLVFHIKYEYNNALYKYVSDTLPDVWPPTDKMITFNMPIKDAWLVDESGERHNVTRKIRKCAGPKRDFHGKCVRIRDVFDYDMDLYPTLEITSVFNQTCTLSTRTDVLKHPLFL